MPTRFLAAAATVLAVWACAAPGSVSAAPLNSGLYEGMVLAVSPEGRVAGHFAMEQGDGVTKRCVFDFVGQRTGGRAAIRTVGAPALTGRLTTGTANAVTFSMARIRNLPGCGLVLPPEAEAASGTELDRIRPGSWTQLARIGGARVVLHTAAGGTAGRAYLVKGDVVGVLARRSGQVQVVFPSERSRWAQGWVPAADLTAF